MSKDHIRDLIFDLHYRIERVHRALWDVGNVLPADAPELFFGQAQQIAVV